VSAEDRETLGERALVTGGAGFLGSHVVAQLVRRGVRVRVLALPAEPLDNLADLDVEVVRGDIRSPDDCRNAVHGVDTVFHVAAMYSAWVKDPEAMYRVNVGGTFHVLEAARREGVGKTIVTASVVALGRPPQGTIGDESTQYDGWALDFPYGRSKHLAMQLALDVAAWGTDVRVVCPAVVLGPGDRGPTPSGRLVLALAAGKAPGYTKGGASYVDVRDAAAGHLAAATRGRAGEIYVLSGHDLSNAALVRAVAEAAGRRPLLLPVPQRLALAWAGVLETLADRRGTIPDVTRTFLRYGSREAFFSSAKATAELGVHFRPIEETLRDAVAWFRAREMA
jgi:dihydroflavonol-4-reductase